MPETDKLDEPVRVDERLQLLGLVSQLASPELGLDTRMDLIEQMRRVLNCETLESALAPVEETIATAWAELAPVEQSW